MSDSADFEEGEVGDLSDFEDGNLVDNSTQSPIDAGNCSSEQIVASCQRDVSVDKQPRDVFGSVGCYGLNHGPKEREENSSSLLNLLSDEEGGCHRKMSCQKRKKKKRDWGQCNSRDRLPAMRQDKVRCRFYLEGRCNKGSDCPFNHGFVPVKKQELCKFYATGSCSKGSSCLFLHGEFPCKFFHLTRNCYHGNSCKFSHKPLTPSTRSLLEKLADNQICNPRVTENGSLDRDNCSIYTQSQIQLPQGALAEPYGDVDYRRMVNPCPPDVGLQACIPCGFQPSIPSASRRPPFDLQPYQVRHPRVDESRPFPSHPGCNGSSSLRVPVASPCRFPVVGLRIPPHRPPIFDEARNRLGRHPRQKFPPSFHEGSKEEGIRETLLNADSISFQGNAAIADSKEGQPLTGLSSPRQSPKEVQHKMLPGMMVNEGDIIYVNKNADDLPPSDFPASSKWQLQPLDVDECPALPQSVSAFASSADPRLKLAYRLPALTPAKEFLPLAPPALVEDNQLTAAIAPPPTKSAFKRRAKLQLNEMANTFAITGTPAQQQSPVAPTVLDPRLLKRRKVEAATASTPAVVEDKQPHSSTSMQIVSPPE